MIFFSGPASVVAHIIHIRGEANIGEDYDNWGWSSHECVEKNAEDREAQSNDRSMWHAEFMLYQYLLSCPNAYRMYWPRLINITNGKSTANDYHLMHLPNDPIPTAQWLAFRSTPPPPPLFPTIFSSVRDFALPAPHTDFIRCCLERKTDLK